MFIVDLQSVLLKGWVLKLKDSIPCPIPVLVQENGRSTAALSSPKIQKAVSDAIDKDQFTLIEDALALSLLLEKHTATTAPPIFVNGKKVMILNDLLRIGHMDFSIA